MDEGFDLKTYLMSDFSNNKHKSISLIELFASDRKYYTTLVERHLIEDEAAKFFQMKGDDVREAESITTDAFRKLKYELIIDEYLNGRKPVKSPEADNTSVNGLNEDTENGSVKKKSEKPTERIEKRGKEQSETCAEQKSQSEKCQQTEMRRSGKPAAVEAPLHCVIDYNVLSKIDIIKVSGLKTGKTLIFPRYECTKCKRKYTMLQGYHDLQPIICDKIKYTNIIRKRDEERYIKYLKIPHVPVPGTEVYAYGKSKPGVCRVCGNKSFSNALIIIPTKKKKKRISTYQVRFCRKCKTYYLSYNVYKEHMSDWALLNEEEVPEIAEELRINAEEKAKRKADLKIAKETQVLKKKEEQLRQQQEEEKRRQERLEREYLARQERDRKTQEQIRRQKQQRVSQLPQPAKTDKVHKHDNNIRVKDFVVRRTTFKCRHNEHQLQNIDAVIDIINKEGVIKQATVSAGYCPNCNVFFIMESTYQNLKMRGTPVCRVSDEKAYLSNSSFVNGMHLAQESILMQYGYTVSQGEGLTNARRRKILAVLIDNKILTKSDIISYLDFFINQRKYQARFEKAIEKWESDREFVSGYKSGSYSQYGVGGIYRKY